MALTKITKTGIGADAIDGNKLGDNSISEEHLDTSVVTDLGELSATASGDDVLLIYDTSAGTLKKIQSSNVGVTPPTFSSVSPTSLETGDLTGNYTIVVTGTKFDATATFKLRTSGGTDISMDSVSRDSSTQLTGTVAKNTANLTNANEPFDIIITNGSGLTVTSEDQINVDAQPVYTTSAGSLGTVDGGSAISTIDIVAADPESAGNVTFDVQSGTIPPGLSTATVNENGVSKFRITGTPTNPSSTTTYNFTLRASDAASNTSSRAFSITVTRIFTSESFTSSGTFSVPSGTTSLSEVLVVAGGGGGGGSPGYNGPGGGGAGGLIFMPEYPVTPGGTITVTVGCGGGGGIGCASSNPSAVGNPGQDSAFGSPGDPGFSPTSSVLTAKGGGGGAGPFCTGLGLPGGSSGGNTGGSPQGNVPGTAATQPTQPGNSGAYGFGNAGGGNICHPNQLGGGGGGAGAAGGPAGIPLSSQPTPAVSSALAPGIGKGGDGRAYTIADGTTPVYYAGGGGGHLANNDSAPGLFAPGGQGGGGDGGWQAPGVNTSTAGQANKGGGGGGNRPDAGRDGGKGIVIVRY